MGNIWYLGITACPCLWPLPLDHRHLDERRNIFKFPLNHNKHLSPAANLFLNFQARIPASPAPPLERRHTLPHPSATRDSAAWAHYRQSLGCSDHIRAGKTFMLCSSKGFGAAQKGLAPCKQTFSGSIAGARCAIAAPKFSQFFSHFQCYLLVFWGRLVLTSWLA